MTQIQAFLTDESGATAVEYGLIVSLVTIILVSGLYAFNESMNTMYSSVGGTVDGAMGG